MKRNTSILFASVIIAVSALFASCSERKDTDGRLERLTDEWAVYASNGENQKLIDSARPILYKALEEEDFNTASYAGAYISQAFSMMFRPDSMYFYIDLIKDRSGRIESGFPAMVISNTVGVYNLIYSMNYSEALYYFYDALDNCDDGRNRAMIMWNIVNTCYLREDTTGIEYAREIHDYGKATEDDYITYIGALACAYMFYQAGTLNSALVYAEETTTLDAYNGNINNSDALHGNILAALGKDREAEAYFQRAIIHSYPDYSTLIESYLSYGQFLAGKGKYDKAINYYRKGLEITEEHSMYFWGHKLYNSMAEAYSAIGRDDIAVNYMRTYSEITDSIFNIEKERAFENLRRGYERQKQELEIRKRDITILTQQKKVQMSLFSAATLAIIATALLVLMKRKSDMYKRLVRNYDSFIMSRNKPEAREESQNSERLRLIYEAMETKMREERIFRNSELNIENAAEAIETNRSYLSKAINTFAGTTFNNYVNMFTGELDEVEDYAYLKKNAERYCISPNGRYIACTFYDFYTDESGSEPSSDINYPALVDTETGEAILFDKAGFMKSMGTTASNDGTLFGNTTDFGDPQGYVFTKGSSSGVPVGEWMMSEYGIITDNNRYVMNISADNNTVSGWRVESSATGTTYRGWYYIGE